MKFRDYFKSIVDGTNISKRIHSLNINRQEQTINFNFGYGRNCKKVKLPFSFFEKSGDGTEPNFDKIQIIDYGHGVAFGLYEAASDCIYDSK